MNLSLFDRVENTVGKGENAGYGTCYFLKPFPFSANISPYLPQPDEINSTSFLFQVSY